MTSPGFELSSQRQKVSRLRTEPPGRPLQKSILLTQPDLAMQVVEEVVTNGKTEIEREEDAKNGTGYAFSPPAPAGGANVAKMGDGKTAAEGAAGAKDENTRGTGNSARTITSMVMTSSSAGTGSSTSYVHSSSSRNPSTTSSRSSFPGIGGMAAGAARRSIIALILSSVDCYTGSNVLARSNP